MPIAGKSAQLQWRHFTLLTNVWAELMVARLKITPALADVFGYDHDLAVLSELIASLPKSRPKALGRASLEDTIAARQKGCAQRRAYSGLPIVEEAARPASGLAPIGGSAKIAALDELFAFVVSIGALA